MPMAADRPALKLSFGVVRLTMPLQPRRLRMAPAAVGCKRRLCRPSFGFRVQRFDDRLRIPRGHAEERQRRSVRRAPPLLPVSQRRDAHPDHERELCLGCPSLARTA